MTPPPAAPAIRAGGEPESPPPVVGDPIPVELVWQGIGPLHKSFFREREPLTALSRALAPWVEPPAQLQVGYDARRFQGWIRLVVPPGGLRVSLVPQGEAVPLQRLAPITRALADWRAAIGGRYDLRVLSFGVGIDFLRGPVHCRVHPGGPPPPDGRVVDPCIELDGDRLCGEPLEDGTVRFPPEALPRLARCFGDG